jgi:ribulose-5-phosphate 4-epimerase/fuculose-1-phosphate aldolase
MEQLIEKYVGKLVSTKLVAKDDIHLGVMDDELIWNRNNSSTEILKDLFSTLNINSILFARPSEPYRSIIDFLAETSDGTIYPKDTETRTFLHDLPVSDSFDSISLTKNLKLRKGVIIPQKGLVTYGIVSPEQAYVFFSSICFATFVKFFSDYLNHKREKSTSTKEEEVFKKVVSFLPDLPNNSPDLLQGPFLTDDTIYKAMCEVGKKTVEYGLVDSYFGNISYFHNSTIYISQTGTSLEELEGVIDPVPLDGTSCTGVTASSELSAHRGVYEKSNIKTILHGHPKFSVILSMDCMERKSCPNSNSCHINCTKNRTVVNTPIITGEVGTGPRGLWKTLPNALCKENIKGAIVYGHGVFTSGTKDFNTPFKTLLETEINCKKTYFNLINSLNLN